MTRERAIEILKDENEKQGHFKGFSMYSEALEMAISALSENKGDLISRQKVLNTLDFADKALTDEVRTVENFKAILTECIGVLSSAENTGEWIIDYRDCGVEFYHCSKCNLGRAVIDGSYYKSLDEFKKCPICGVDMRGEQDG